MALVAVVVVGKMADQPREAGEPAVAATIFPLADIVQNVVGEEIKVVQVIPAGASPHSYALTPQQVAQVQGARIIFAIGHGLDNPIIDSVIGISEVQVVTVDEGIELREFEGGGVDPHYWLVAPNAEKIAATVALKMEQIDPDRAEQYKRNLKNYLEQLDILEAELQTAAGNIEQRSFVAMHDSWSYFADRYGLDMVATYEPVEGHSPSVADLKILGDLISQRGITAFYAEPQKASMAAVRFLKDEFELQIRTLDPIGGVDGKYSYVELMRANMRALSPN